MIDKDVIPTPQRAGGEHRPQMDGLRFFAFLGIFLLHCNSGKFPAGHLGVPLFFVLSGFLITRILLRNEGDSLAGDLGIFYARRALRIFPLYYATLIVLLACGQLARPWLAFLYLYNYGIYFHQGFFGGNGHFWTLAVEEQFYLLFPLILLATPARRRGMMLAGLVAACAVSRLVMEWASPNPYTFMTLNAAGEYLVAGAIAGYLDVARPGVAGSRARFALAAGLSVLVAFWQSGWWLGAPWLAPVKPEIAALAFALLIWELWRARGPVAALLGARPLAYLGKVSYGCYVLHVYAIHYVYSRTPGGPLIGDLAVTSIPAGARAPVALALSIALAMVSWHLFESPILALKSRFPYGRAPKSRREREALTRPDAVASATQPGWGLAAAEG